MTNDIHPVFERCDLVIDTDDRTLPEELMGTEGTPDVDSTIELSDGTRVAYQGTYVQKALGGTDAVMLAVDADRDVSLGVFSAWLYERLTSREVSISTPRGTLRFDDSVTEAELETILGVLLTEDDTEETTEE